MRSWIVFTTLALVSGLASAADPIDTPQSRREAAERYAKVTDTRKLLLDTVEAMAQNFPQERRETFRKLMNKHVRVEVLEAAMMAAMQKHFTTAELNALADFYGSDAGRSAMAKLGPYLSDVMPIVQAEMARAVAELQNEMATKPASSGS